MGYDALFEELIDKIKILSETVWEGRIKVPQINKWLNNFIDEKERLHALYLLSQFMYFGELQIRQLTKSLYRDFYQYPTIESIRCANNNTLDSKVIQAEFKLAENNTRFVGIGNPSESGTHILYLFRQENKLASSLFISDGQILKTDKEGNDVLANASVKHYVFIDDFCGSGEQAITYSNIVNKIKAIDKNIMVSYLMLFSTSTGKKRVMEEASFDFVEAVVELDQSFKCFDTKSRYFQDHPSQIDKEFLLDLCSRYGRILMRDICSRLGHKEPYLSPAVEKVKLGWGDCQLLIGFKHNIPDNTLPIIWYGEDGVGWYPVFKRHNKKYNP